jgi:hypothetical protein
MTHSCLEKLLARPFDDRPSSNTSHVYINRYDIFRRPRDQTSTTCSFCTIPVSSQKINCFVLLIGRALTCARRLDQGFEPLYQQIASLKNPRWRGSGPRTEEGDGAVSMEVAEKRNLEYHPDVGMEICLIVRMVKAVYCQTDTVMGEKSAKVIEVGAVRYTQMMLVLDKYSRIDEIAAQHFFLNTEEAAARQKGKI